MTKSQDKVNSTKMRTMVKRGVKELSELFNNNKENVNECFERILGHGLGKGDKEHPEYDKKYDLDASEYRSCKYVCDNFNTIIGLVHKFGEFSEQEEKDRQKRVDKKPESTNNSPQVVQFSKKAIKDED